jgi:hypothetical protein
MKKLFIIAAIGTFVLSSCKKDWTCRCSVNGIDIGTEDIKDKTKKEATSECEGKGMSIAGYTLACSID